MLACSVALSACFESSKSPIDTITTIIGAPLSTLNPLFATDANSQHLSELNHATLTHTGKNIMPEPYLAKRFKYLNDLTLEVELKQGCLFHNGREVSADDVEYSWLTYIDEKNKSPFAEHFKKISKFEKINRYLFRLHLKSVSPALIIDLNFMKIFPKENPSLGAGPYKIVKQSGEEILFERSPTPCLPQPKMAKIKVKVVRDDLSRYLKLQRGEIDFILNELNFRKIEAIEKDPSSPLKVSASDGTDYSYMALNFRDAKLKDWRVRKALALSFDIPAVIQYKLRGMAVAAKTILANQNWYANTSLRFVDRNLTEAKRLLNEAGSFNGEHHRPPLALVLTTTTHTAGLADARVLIAQAKEVGIQIQHRVYDWGTFYADVKAKNTQLYLLRWVAVTDPQIYFENFYSGEIPRGNRTSYQNPAVDKLLQAGESTMNPQKRKAIYLKVQKILANDFAYISLWHSKNTAAYGKNIHNVQLYPHGSWETFFYLEKTAQ